MPIAYSIKPIAVNSFSPSRQKIQHPDYPADAGESPLVVGFGMEPVEPDTAVMRRMNKPDFSVFDFGDDAHVPDAAAAGITPFEENQVAGPGFSRFDGMSQQTHRRAGMRQQHTEFLKTESDKTTAIKTATGGPARAVPDVKVFFGEVEDISRKRFQRRRTDCVNCRPLGKRYIQETEENPC